MSDEVMLDPGGDAMGEMMSAEEAAPSESAELSALQDNAAEPAHDWRAELAAKMHDYRVRRKPRTPKYPSLQLPFENDAFRSAAPEVFLSALALEPQIEPERASGDGLRIVPSAGEAPAVVDTVAVCTTPTPAVTNLIEFPRTMESEAWDGLAEPMIEQPRILDAPELVPSEPALGGILLEAPEANPNPATGVPLRPASIGRRVAAVAVDLCFVGCGVGLWGWVASKVTHEIPPRTQFIIAALVASGVLWLGYQYLLMVYSGTTLGLRACRLELVNLDGSLPGKKQRRWRWLASLLSAASMMLGYAWVLLDENHLCWHDRITHTHLRVRDGSLA